jgi:hypothetical protein
MEWLGRDGILAEKRKVVVGYSYFINASNNQARSGLAQ